jgi:hypothetical protein
MTQSDANQSPWLNSLITRENTGNFNDFGRLGAELRRKSPVFYRVFVGIPYSTEQGILKRQQRIILPEQGIFFK